MTNHADMLKLVEISRLYYERNLTQAEIVMRMNVSRPAISKCLDIRYLLVYQIIHIFS